MSTQTTLERPAETSRLIPLETPGEVSRDAISQALAEIESLMLGRTEEMIFTPEDDGLGCMRGMAVVFAINVVILGLGSVAWALWHLVR